MAKDRESQLPPFIGCFLRKMRKGMVSLPSHFLRKLPGKEIHLITGVENNYKYIRLIPAEKDVNRKGIEEALRSAEILEPGVEYVYHGAYRLTKAGYITIPKKIREKAGFEGGEVIIVGMFYFIEVWNRIDWEAETEKRRKEHPEFWRNFKGPLRYL